MEKSGRPPLRTSGFTKSTGDWACREIHDIRQTAWSGARLYPTV